MSGNDSRAWEVRGCASKNRVRFGQVAINLSYINRKELKLALGIQRKLSKTKGEAPPLGEILVRKGFMSNEHRQRVYEQQGRLGGHTDIPGYDLQKKIGSGTMGTVYRANQLSMQRTVAIKVLAPRLAARDTFVERFVTDARSVTRLNHPHILQSFDAGVVNGIPHVTMEFINGPTVAERIERRERMSCSNALRIVNQITRALEHAHDQDLVHRNIKPENLMITGDGHAKLCDLGSAGLVEELMREEHYPVTPYYMSPEQALGTDSINIQSDIYALGASLYHMVTGRMPFDGSNAREILKQHAGSAPTPPSDHHDDLPSEMDELVLNMMHKEREKRHQTPSDLREHIEEVLHRDQQENRSDDSPDGPSRRRRRLYRR